MYLSFNNIYDSLVYCNNLFCKESYFNLFEIFILVISCIVSIFSFNYNKYNSISNFEFNLLLISSIICSLMLCMSNNFLILYILLEFFSFNLYLLISINKTKKDSIE